MGTLQMLSVRTGERTRDPVSKVGHSTIELLPPRSPMASGSCSDYDLAVLNTVNRPRPYLSLWWGVLPIPTLDLSSLIPVAQSRNVTPKQPYYFLAESTPFPVRLQQILSIKYGVNHLYK